MKRRLISFTGILLLAAGLVLAVPATVSASQMHAEADKTEVSVGEEITVEVTFSGTEIWFAFLKISAEDPILEGGGSFLIEPEQGQSSVSQTCRFYAVSPGQTTILAEGYTDEDEANPVTVPIAITVSEGTAKPSSRGADVDENYRNAEGEYINRRDPAADAEEPSQDAEAVSSEPAETASEKKESLAEEKESTSSAAEIKTGKNEKNETSPALILVIAAIAVLAAAAVTAGILYTKKNRNRKTLKKKPEDERENE